MRHVQCLDLGFISFKEAWDLQENLMAKVIEQKLAMRTSKTTKIPDNYLLFCQHPHVYTLGKSGDASHVIFSSEELEKKGIEFYKINRGGDITYHGPGQWVVYPIFDLDQFFTDIHKYLRYLEEVIIETLSEYVIKSESYPSYTGVWIDSQIPRLARKICAMGVRCSRWVTMHGLALNVNTDLSYFQGIIPCGIDDKQVTSMQKELSKEVNMEEIKQKLMNHLQKKFDFSWV